jgi:hypothetical protein
MCDAALAPEQANTHGRTTERHRRRPTVSRKIWIALALAIVAITGLWLYRHFSPYQICVRVNTQQAIESGQQMEQATDFATTLCTAKMPLRR